MTCAPEGVAQSAGVLMHREFHANLATSRHLRGVPVPRSRTADTTRPAEVGHDSCSHKSNFLI